MTKPYEVPTTIRWAADGRRVRILDQTRLPTERLEVDLQTVEEFEEAIQSLRVRGAPLIGITAAMGIGALARQRADEGLDADSAIDAVSRDADRLAAARPTAINLVWAIERVRGILSDGTGSAAELAERLSAEANDILSEDRRMCRAIGEHAAILLQDGDAVITHCNAGSLATGGIGTALAPVYVATESGKRVSVFADETRPLLQGSRLTAWELSQAGIDVTVISDNMAAALFAQHPPDIVFVGSDRIAANGDVANKVGTYGLAVLARHHGVPFYVLAPTSTVDLQTPTGADIPIEHRSADEVRRGFGKLTAPVEVAVWSPAFDVTPHELVTGIVTEAGIHVDPYGPALAEAVRLAADGRTSD
ncbi:MAG: S-methyl-5-thioribose-1-phosphate isomerase [Gemmatimonadota bacterium]|nr:S-methyl-5-thioribose-1-phosphate isomerase [Gemmatimonadota bacterium]